MTNKKIFVACDTSSLKEIKKIINNTKTNKLQIIPKFGLQFFYSKNGRAFLQNFKRDYFLDLKINDIPQTALSAIDSLKDLVSKEVSDDELKNASNTFPINTPRNKEEYYYRTIFSDHFSSKAASLSVPSVPSVACSTPQALEWDEAFKNMNDPSGRSISNIHNESYE